MDATIPSPVDPTIGGAASMVYGNDWYPATVILIATQLEFMGDEAMTQRERPVITVQQDRVADYGRFESDPNGATVIASKRDDGIWRAIGSDTPIIVVGTRQRIDA